MRNENRQTRTSLPNIKKAQAKKKNDRIITLPLLYIGMLKKHGFILSHNVELSRKKLQKDELCVNFYSLHKSFALYSVHFTIKV